MEPFWSDLVSLRLEISRCLSSRWCLGGFFRVGLDGGSGGYGGQWVLVLWRVLVDCHVGGDIWRRLWWIYLQCFGWPGVGCFGNFVG